DGLGDRQIDVVDQGAGAGGVVGGARIGLVGADRRGVGRAQRGARGGRPDLVDDAAAGGDRADVDRVGPGRVVGPAGAVDAAGHPADLGAGQAGGVGVGELDAGGARVGAGAVADGDRELDRLAGVGRRVIDGLGDRQIDVVDQGAGAGGVVGGARIGLVGADRRGVGRAQRGARGGRPDLVDDAAAGGDRADVDRVGPGRVVGPAGAVDAAGHPADLGAGQAGGVGVGELDAGGARVGAGAVADGDRELDRLAGVGRRVIDGLGDRQIDVVDQGAGAGGVVGGARIGLVGADRRGVGRAQRGARGGRPDLVDDAAAGGDRADVDRVGPGRVVGPAGAVDAAGHPADLGAGQAGGVGVGELDAGGARVGAGAVADGDRELDRLAGVGRRVIDGLGDRQIDVVDQGAGAGGVVGGARIGLVGADRRGVGRAQRGARGGRPDLVDDAAAGGDRADVDRVGPGRVVGPAGAVDAAGHPADLGAGQAGGVGVGELDAGGARVGAGAVADGDRELDRLAGVGRRVIDGLGDRQIDVVDQGAGAGGVVGGARIGLVGADRRGVGRAQRGARGGRPDLVDDAAAGGDRADVDRVGPGRVVGPAGAVDAAGHPADLGAGQAGGVGVGELDAGGARVGAGAVADGDRELDRLAGVGRRVIDGLGDRQIDVVDQGAGAGGVVGGARIGLVGADRRGVGRAQRGARGGRPDLVDDAAAGGDRADVDRVGPGRVVGPAGAVDAAGHPADLGAGQAGGVGVGELDAGGARVGAGAVADGARIGLVGADRRGVGRAQRGARGGRPDLVDDAAAGGDRADVDRVGPGRVVGPAGAVDAAGHPADLGAGQAGGVGVGELDAGGARVGAGAVADGDRELDRLAGV